MRYYSLGCICFIAIIFIPSRGICVSFFASSEETCEETCKADSENGMKGEADLNLRTPDFIKRNGYPVATHRITTEDGYILTYFRIPFSKKSPAAPNKKAVIVMHGQFFSSVGWMFQPADRALVFMLADAGYDVWIGNFRGTSYSLGHEKLSNKELPYWNFSAHEMGKYDIPAAIKYILKTNGQSDLYYIGHSIGTAQLFIALSLNPSLNKYIRTMFAMAPIIYQGNATSPPHSVAQVLYYSWPVLNVVGQGRFIPSVFQKLFPYAGLTCENSAINCNLCDNTVFYIFGSDPCQLNYTTLPALASHLPDSVSAKTFVHSSQLVVNGLWRQFDYGVLLNLEIYGRSTPPDYIVKNIQIPVVLFGGLKDNRVVPEDFARTSEAIPNLRGNYTVEYPLWNHIDFVTGIDGDKYVYNRILSIMDESN